MAREARLERGEAGLFPANPPDGDGWFVLNLAEARWRETDAFGASCSFESPAHPFPHLGVNVHVLLPGKPACLYHRETFQEDFLVLEGECTLLVEEEERHLRAWDFVHCPPGVAHVLVGRDAPCAILMIGSRRDEEGGTHDADGNERGITYPVSELAGRHGASAEAETNDPREAYAGRRGRAREVPAPWPARGGGEPRPER